MSVSGSLDATTASCLTAWAQAFTRCPCRRAGFDLAGLDFVDLAGARALACACRLLRASGTMVDVTGLSETASRVMTLTGIAPAGAWHEQARPAVPG